MLLVILNVLVVLVFVLPVVAVGICFAARRLGDELAGYYVLQTLVVWFGVMFAALILSRGA